MIFVILWFSRDFCVIVIGNSPITPKSHFCDFSRFLPITAWFSRDCDSNVCDFVISVNSVILWFCECDCTLVTITRFFDPCLHPTNATPTKQKYLMFDNTHLECCNRLVVTILSRSTSDESTISDDIDNGIFDRHFDMDWEQLPNGSQQRM